MPFPILKTGLTKDQILNNLLFRLEDIENYEKDYGLNIDLVKKTIKEGSEFALYDSIINGGNRPFLDKFSDEKHIQQLLDDFWSVKLVIGKNGFEPSTNSDQIRLDAFVKNGDTIVLEIDENEELLRGTLKDLCPNRSPGRPKEERLENFCSDKNSRVCLREFFLPSP